MKKGRTWIEWGVFIDATTLFSLLAANEENGFPTGDDEDDVGWARGFQLGSRPVERGLEEKGERRSKIESERGRLERQGTRLTVAPLSSLPSPHRAYHERPCKGESDGEGGRIYGC